MNKQEINICLSVMIQAVSAAGGRYPNGHFYAAMMNRVDLSTYNALLGVLLTAGIVENQMDELILTEKGEAMARDIERLLNESR